MWSSPRALPGMVPAGSWWTRLLVSRGHCLLGSGVVEHTGWDLCSASCPCPCVSDGRLKAGGSEAQRWHWAFLLQPLRCPLAAQSSPSYGAGSNKEPCSLSARGCGRDLCTWASWDPEPALDSRTGGAGSRRLPPWRPWPSGGKFSSVPVLMGMLLTQGLREQGTWAASVEHGGLVLGGGCTAGLGPAVSLAVM